MVLGRTGPAAILMMLTLVTSDGRSDDAQNRYFEQLRHRNLHSLATAEAISRLENPSIVLSEKSDLTIQLSKTMVEQARDLPDDQRDEMWGRARSVVERLLEADPSNPRALMLRAQLASAWISEASWLRAERENHPFDEQILKRSLAATDQGLEMLRTIERTLADPPVEPSVKKGEIAAPTSHELRLLLHQIRWEFAEAYRNLAEISPVETAERTNHAGNSEQYLKQLIDVADEPLQTRARILLATCSRLAGKPDRASEILSQIEKGNPLPTEELLAERARILLEQKRPTDAAQLLLKARGKRQRLTGELWYLQTKALIALRSVTLDKQQEALSEELAEQIATVVQRCEEQVGGYWSRRCRELWDDSQTALKFGPELDALMQQARNDFTSGRIEGALDKYGKAELSAKTSGNTDLAMELGFTRASILLDQKEFAAAGAEFLRLSADYSQSQRAANAHLLGAYSLGRDYDSNRTQARRIAYASALDRHLENYSNDASVNDARFMKAQLEEQRLQSSSALPLYLQVESTHSRATDAMAGAARCYETILRRLWEREIPASEIEHQAVKSLTEFLQSDQSSSGEWTINHADIALRLVSILLMDPIDAIEGRAASSKGAVLDAIADEPGTNRFQQARVWLDKVAEFTVRNASDTGLAEGIATLRTRGTVLEIVVHSFHEDFAEAAALLDSLPTSSGPLLSVVSHLSSLLRSSTADKRQPIANLQVRAAEKLAVFEDKLSVSEQELLQKSLVHSYLTTGQFDKAVGLATKLSEANSKNLEKQRELARVLGNASDSATQNLAQQCWRRVESLMKPGSPEWLLARYEVLMGYVRMKQNEEGRKLLHITRVLYPELGGPDLKPRFDALEKQLGSRN